MIESRFFLCFICGCPIGGLAFHYLWGLAPKKSFSERHADHHAEAVLVGGGELVVAETTDVLDVEELEDVVDAQRELHIGTLGVDDI